MSQILIRSAIGKKKHFDIDIRLWQSVCQWRFLEPLAARISARAHYCGPARSLWQLRNAIETTLQHSEAALLRGVDGRGRGCECLITRATFENMERMVYLQQSITPTIFEEMERLARLQQSHNSTNPSRKRAIAP